MEDSSVFKNSLVCLLGSVTALLLPATASSVPLTEPAGFFADFALPGTTVAARPELAGVVLEDVSTPYAFSGAGETLEGTIQNSVLRSVDGTLDFYWRILPSGGTGGIDAFRLTGFSGFTLDADWRLDGLGDIAPDTARYFGIESGSVNFLFGTEVGVGNTSYFFFLDTEARRYARTGAYDLLCAPTDCISPEFETFAPVPEPITLTLVGLGLAGIGYKRRQSKKA